MMNKTDSLMKTRHISDDHQRLDPRYSMHRWGQESGIFQLKQPGWSGLLLSVGFIVCSWLLLYVLEGGQGGQSRKNGTFLPWMSEDEFFNMALTKASSAGVVTVTHLHWPLSIFIVVGRTERVLGCSPRILYFSPLAIFEEVDILTKDLGEAVLINKQTFNYNRYSTDLTL